jgi:hypothetical protein
MSYVHITKEPLQENMKKNSTAVGRWKYTFSTEKLIFGVIRVIFASGGSSKVSSHNKGYFWQPSTKIKVIFNGRHRKVVIFDGYKATVENNPSNNYFRWMHITAENS